MVRKITISTKEEVQNMNPGTLNSKIEDHPSTAEGMDARDVKTPVRPSASSSENC